MGRTWTGLRVPARDGWRAPVSAQSNLALERPCLEPLPLAAGSAKTSSPMETARASAQQSRRAPRRKAHLGQVVVPATIPLVAVKAVAVVLTVCTAAAELTATQALMSAADDGVRVSGAAALCRDGASFFVGRGGSGRGNTGKRESSDEHCDASPSGTQSSPPNGSPSMGSYRSPSNGHNSRPPPVLLIERGERSHGGPASPCRSSPSWTGAASASSGA
jgi:hypothetical protein